MNAPLAEMRRLHDRGPHARGLVVDADGVLLGPDCVLVERTNRGYRRINAATLDRLVKATFGDDHRFGRFSLVLDHITEALAAGDLVKAQLLGLEVPLRLLDDQRLKRLRSASRLMKDGFDPNQPRDDRGRWTAEGGGGSSEPTPRTQDQQPAPVSIEQLWLASFRGPPDLRDSNSPVGFNEAGYPGDYHDFLRDHLAEITRAAGGQAITEVPLTGINGVTAKADLLVRPPGWPIPFIMEIKTGEKPQFTDAQRVVYPLAMIGGHATSFDPRVADLGLPPGGLFPPLMLLTVRTLGPGSPIEYKWEPIPMEKFVVAIFMRVGGPT